VAVALNSIHNWLALWQSESAHPTRRPLSLLTLTLTVLVIDVDCAAMQNGDSNCNLTLTSRICKDCEDSKKALELLSFTGIYAQHVIVSSYHTCRFDFLRLGF
jgi:hypothetical protein